MPTGADPSFAAAIYELFDPVDDELVSLLIDFYTPLPLPDWYVHTSRNYTELSGTTDIGPIGSDKPPTPLPAPKPLEAPEPNWNSEAGDWIEVSGIVEEGSEGLGE